MIDLYLPEKAPSHRQQKVAEEVKYIVAELMRDDNLPLTRVDEVLLKPNAPITITRVDISPDLRHATVYAMPLGGIDQDKMEKYLKENAWYIKTYVAKNLKTRISPRLTFKLDLQFADHERINKLLGKNIPN